MVVLPGKKVLVVISRCSYGRDGRKARFHCTLTFILLFLNIGFHSIPFSRHVHLGIIPTASPITSRKPPLAKKVKVNKNLLLRLQYVVSSDFLHCCLPLKFQFQEIRNTIINSEQNQYRKRISCSLNLCNKIGTNLKLLFLRETPCTKKQVNRHLGNFYSI